MSSPGGIEDEEWPVGSENVWLFSCRPSNSMDYFAKKTLLFQPKFVARHTGAGRKRDRGKEEKTQRVAWPVEEIPETIPSFLSNRTVILIVHGLGESYMRVISYLEHLGSRNSYEFDVDAQPGLLAFTWPSQSISYLAARVATQRAAKYLTRAIQLLLHHNNKVILIGHSLGCRVCLNALLDMKAGSVSSLLLVAAGVASNALRRNGEYPAHRIKSDEIKVFYSKRDDMLQVGFLFEFFPGLLTGKPIAATIALGVNGSDIESENPKLENVNCTREVKGHSFHFYCKSNIFLSELDSCIQRISNEGVVSRL